MATTTELRGRVRTDYIGTIHVEFAVTDCPNCGVIFGVPQDLIGQRRRDNNLFYCPNGHSMSFTVREIDQVRKELEQAKQRIASEIGWSERLEKDLAAERKSHASTKGQLTKTKKRVQAGVCPVDGCHRHFTNLERHMATKHPETQSLADVTASRKGTEQ